MSHQPPDLAPYLSLIDADLAKQVTQGDPRSLYEPQRYTIALGGKRIRPVMTLLAAGLCGGRIQDALPAAVCVEMTHTFTLIHDDIMDLADTRRGKPTVFRKWDTPTAILAGDGMFVQAMMNLDRLPDALPVSTLRRLYNVYFQGVNEVCEGQALDMEFATRDSVSLQDYMRMIDGKTAALLRTALVMGGLSVDASPEQISLLKELGTQLGLAFQIQDDVLDLVADPDAFGKTVGGDIIEGKMTYLMTSAFETVSGEDATLLRGVLSKATRGASDVANVRALFERSGVLDRAIEAYQQRYTRSTEALDAFDDSPFKRDLSGVIGMLRNRIS